MKKVIDLGKIGITLAGEYNDKTIYEKLTIILYKGKSYISTKTTQGVSPEEDILVWQLVAEAKDAYHMLIDAGKTTLTEEEFLEQLVDATKGRYIVQGNIINAADEEDLTVEHSDLLGIDTLKLANRDNTNGMGYVILRKNKSFAEQVTKENTIYEIRYEFDLKGESVNLPFGCTLTFNGGKIINGKLIGKATSLLGNFTTLASVLESVFLDGTYTNKENSFSWWGGIANDNTQVVKQNNLAIFLLMVKNKLNIKFDDEYYISNETRVVLDYVAYIYGNGIVHNLLLNFANNGGIFADGLSFVDDFGYQLFIYSDSLLDITIPNICLHNCTFNYRRVMSLDFQDINSDTTHFGIDNFVVEGCRFLNGASIRLLDCPVWSPTIIQNNRFENANITPIYIAWQHSKKVYPQEAGTYEYVEEGILNTHKITIKGNYFKGNVVSINEYYCAALVNTNVIEFCNNYIEDFINYTDEEIHANATCYDAYLNCAEVYYHDNIIKNVFAFTKNGGTRPLCEIFKSKINPVSNYGKKMVREYINNVWTSNSSRIIEYNPEEYIVIDIFLNTDTAHIMRYEGNEITLDGIVLNGKNSGYGGSENFYFINNKINAKRITNNLLTMSTSNKKYGEIVFKNNILSCAEDSIIYITDTANSSVNGFASLIVKNNTCINSYIHVSIAKADHYIIKNNIGGMMIRNSNIYLPYSSGETTPFVSNDMYIEYSLNNNDSPSDKSLYCCVSEQTKGNIVFSKRIFSPYNERLFVKLLYDNITMFHIKESYSVYGEPKSAYVEFVNNAGTLQVKLNGIEKSLVGNTKIYEEDNLTIRVSDDASSKIATIEIGNVASSGLTSTNDRTNPIKITLTSD